MIPVSSEEARAVLWFFSEDGGLEPGSFGVALIKAIARADRFNRAKLGMGFPGYVEAYRRAIEDIDGITTLQTIAGVKR